MEDYNQEYQTPNKSIKGYQVIIVILAVILAALSFQYFRQVRQLKSDFSVERDTLTSRFEQLVVQYDNIKTENDTISLHLGVERDKADSLLQRLQKERSFSASKIRSYEKELGTLRTVMRGFIVQIDSLNTLNKKLASENVEYRKQVSTERLRADMAEEKASELTTKIRKGAVVRAREIGLVALSNSDREVTRAARATRLRIDFVLAANELAPAGEREVYVRITGPDGYVLANASNNTFAFEGDRLTYSAVRSVDYQNQDLSVSLYYNGSGVANGNYKIAVYMDGYQIGSSEILLR